MNKIKLCILLFCITSISFSQEYYPKTNGVKTPEKSSTVFINATIYVSPTEIIKNGTLIIENNKIVAVGKNISIPSNVEKIDLKGKTIYPSFIDIYSSFGIKKVKKAIGLKSPQYDANRKGFYWNDHIIRKRRRITKIRFWYRKYSYRRCCSSRHRYFSSTRPKGKSSIPNY